MDGRFLFVFLPVLIALSWVLFNIGRLALQQVQKLTR
jgi:hypothetical protein